MSRTVSENSQCRLVTAEVKQWHRQLRYWSPRLWSWYQRAWTGLCWLDRMRPSVQFEEKRPPGQRQCWRWLRSAAVLLQRYPADVAVIQMAVQEECQASLAARKFTVLMNTDSRLLRGYPYLQEVHLHPETAATLYGRVSVAAPMMQSCLLCRPVWHPDDTGPRWLLSVQPIGFSTIDEYAADRNTSTLKVPMPEHKPCN